MHTADSPGIGVKRCANMQSWLNKAAELASAAVESVDSEVTSHAAIVAHGGARSAIAP